MSKDWKAKQFKRFGELESKEFKLPEWEESAIYNNYSILVTLRSTVHMIFDSVHIV
jgi:hypothetical protein